LESVCRPVSRWQLRELPLWFQILITGVVAAYIGAVCAAAAVTRVQAGQLRLFTVLLACSAAAVELIRKSGEPSRGVRDVYAIWDLPAAVLLPPVYALLAPVLQMILAQLRVRRTALHRRAYAVAAAGLACAAASLLFRAAAPVLGLGTGAGTGQRAMLWMILTAGCGVLQVVVNDGLLLAVAKRSASGTRLLPQMAGVEALYGRIAELSLGTLAASAAARAPLALLYTLPLVVAVQRSLRHAQLVAETRLDGKTGLLNDKAWRLQAAGEIGRAVRTRTPIAVGILDIDHFKKINDTYGHPAGDAVLSAVAAATAALLRDYDITGRVGGEEFAFLLPGSAAREAVEIAERLREKISRLEFSSRAPGGPMPYHVTVSIGVAAVSRPRWDLDRYYDLADQALYAAKRSGRDAVWVVQADQAADLKPAPASAVRTLAGRDAANLHTEPHRQPERPGRCGMDMAGRADRSAAGVPCPAGPPRRARKPRRRPPAGGRGQPGRDQSPSLCRF
jgi:diguanylate cyclase (GGDEF)-like protein